MFFRFALISFGVALCFAHNGECNEGESLVPSAEWPAGEFLGDSQSLPLQPNSALQPNLAIQPNLGFQQNFAAPLQRSFAAPLQANFVPLQPNFQPSLAPLPLSGLSPLPLGLSGLPMSPARAVLGKPNLASRTTSFPVKGREIIQQQVQEPIIEAPIKGQRAALPIKTRSYPTKSLPVQQQIQEPMPIREVLPTKGQVQEPLPVQEQIITREEPQIIEGVKGQRLFAPMTRSYPTKGGPIIQEQVQIQEPIRTLPVKGQLPVVQEPAPIIEPQRVYPTKSLPVQQQIVEVQEPVQVPVQETITREDVQEVLPTKGGSIGAGRVFSAENLASPVFSSFASTRSHAARALNLPANADVVVNGINFAFTCENMPYGYYADIANNCQIYHICQPGLDNIGNSIMQRFSFFCPAGTLFDQQKHVCVSTLAADLTPCALASRYFPHTVSRFAAPAMFAPPMLAASSSNFRSDFGSKGVVSQTRSLPLPPAKGQVRAVEPLPVQQQELVQEELPLPVQQTQQFETLKA